MKPSKHRHNSQNTDSYALPFVNEENQGSYSSLGFEPFSFDCGTAPSRHKKKKANVWKPLLICVICALLLTVGALLFLGKSTESNTSTMPFFEKRYFLNRLSRDELDILFAMYDGMMTFEETITLPHNISTEKLSSLVLLLHHECPELFQYDFSNGFTYYVNESNLPLIKVSYTYSKDEYLSMRKQCEDIINSFVLATADMSDFEKEKYVYDWFGQNCIYSKNADNSDNPFGAFINKAAKCDGISLAMKWAMEAMDIQCLCVGGSSKTGGEGHAWNIINIDQMFYILDATFSVSKDESADFQIYAGFNTSDAWINENYALETPFFEFTDTPKCTIASNSFYALNNGFVPSQASAEEVILKKLDDLEAGKIDKIELQFEDAADYTDFINNSDAIIYNALEIHNAPPQNIVTFELDYYSILLLFE